MNVDHINKKVSKTKMNILHFCLTKNTTFNNKELAQICSSRFKYKVSRKDLIVILLNTKEYGAKTWVKHCIERSRNCLSDLFYLFC